MWPIKPGLRKKTARNVLENISRENGVLPSVVFFYKECAGVSMLKREQVETRYPVVVGVNEAKLAAKPVDLCGIARG